MELLGAKIKRRPFEEKSSRCITLMPLQILLDNKIIIDQNLFNKGELINTSIRFLSFTAFNR